MFFKSVWKYSLIMGSSKESPHLLLKSNYNQPKTSLTAQTMLIMSLVYSGYQWMSIYLDRYRGSSISYRAYCLRLINFADFATLVNL